MIIKLSKKQFVPFSYTVKEFYDYWLYYYMWEEKEISYNTFMSYRNIIQNYIVPSIGKKILSTLKREDLLGLLIPIQSQDLLRLACSVITNAFQFAREKNFISSNISIRISKEVKRIKNQAKNDKNISARDQKKMKVYTLEQTEVILRTCRQEEPGLYLPLLLAVTTGLRLSDDDDKIRLNQRKPSKYKGLRRFGPEKNLQRINKFMKERPIFYKNLIQMKENIRFYLRCFYCITKVMILQFNSENRTELARNG